MCGHGGGQVRGNDSEFVSASSDGSCIIWDMRRFVRNNSLFASTFFKAVPSTHTDARNSTLARELHLAQGGAPLFLAAAC